MDGFFTQYKYITQYSYSMYAEPTRKFWCNGYLTAIIRDKCILLEDSLDRHNSCRAHDDISIC